MSDKKLKIAIISDLHCHTSNIQGSPCTYLITDKLRSPVKNHPVESLIKIINEDEITVDLTLCPGDFTDKADIQGFISGWDFSLEINQQLKSKNIIATLGNHDVDVYQTKSNYSLETAKGIKRGFPIKDEALKDTLWSKGCVFVEGDNYRILVINSSHFHYNKDSCHNGEISSDAIDYIEQYLSTRKDDKIQIAMSHHPPISHPRKELGEDDKIVNGDALLDLLGKNNFDLFIYGHKHDPFIKYHLTTGGNNKITLFSAGSFSAVTNILFAGPRNAFHTIELNKRSGVCKGKILTWTYLPDAGWKKNFDESAFAPISGFGNEKSVDNIFTELKEFMEDKNSISWDKASEAIEDLNHLIPEDSKKLYDLLQQNKFNTDEHMWKGAKLIYNLNKLGL